MRALKIFNFSASTPIRLTPCRGFRAVLFVVGHRHTGAEATDLPTEPANFMQPSPERLGAGDESTVDDEGCHAVHRAGSRPTGSLRTARHPSTPPFAHSDATKMKRPNRGAC